MSVYASQTQVSSERSRNEIERILQRYGATQFAYGWQGERAILGFQLAARMIRFELPLPDRTAEEFIKTPAGRRRRNIEAQHDAWEQACRQRWRALALVIKAKLEAVESNITTIEDEFLAHIVLPNGRTFGSWAAPQLAEAYENKKMPPLLGA